MRNRLLIMAAACISLGAAAQINSPSPEGYMLRASQMMADGNYVGCIDQAKQALAFPLAPAQAEAARLMLAQATVHTNKAQAADMLCAWLADYPASAMRNDALLSLADCFAGRQALELYADVDPMALDLHRRHQLYYRMACAYLEAGKLGKAAEYFALIGSDSPFADAARFYRGYLAYAQGDNDRALQLLERARSSQAPGNAADLYIAQIQYGRENWSKAYSAASAAMSAAADYPGMDAAQARAEAARIAGESAFRLGNMQQARTLLQQYSGMMPAMRPSASYILGLMAYRDGDYEQAARLMAPAAVGDDAMAQTASLHQGQALLKLNEYDRAIMAFDHAIKLGFDPDVKETAYYNYAVASMRGAKLPFGNTVRTFEDFLQMFPDSRYAPQVQEYVVSAYFSDRDWAGAVASIDAMSAPSASTRAARQSALVMLGYDALQAGNAKDAIEPLEQALAMGQADAQSALQANLLLGEAYYRDGSLDKAASQLEAYMRQAPAASEDRAMAMYDLGYVRFQQKRYADAIQQFGNFLQAAPSAPQQIRADAFCRLGDSHFYSNDYDKAAKAYKDAAKAYPAAGDYAMFQTAMMEGYQRHHERKIQLMQDMLAAFPASALAPDALLETTESMLQLGRSRDAIDTYRTLIASYPGTSQARRGELDMATTMLNAGMRSEAVSAYKHLISSYPTSDEAVIATDQLKRVAAADGSLSEFAAFMASVPDAPQIDADEMERLAFEAAEQDWIENGSIAKLQAYVGQFAAEGATANAASAAKAYAYLAEEAWQRADYDAAYAAASAIARKYPHSASAAEALAMMGMIDEQYQRWSQALADWTALEALASTPHYANMSRLGVARASLQAGKAEEALRAATDALASAQLGDADRMQALWLSGTAHQALGNEAEAQQAWRQAIGTPTDEYSMRSSVSLGESLLRTGDASGALEVAQQAASSGSPHVYWLARAFIVVADAYAASGDEFRSQQYLQSLRDNYPGTEEDIFMMINQRLAAE